MVDIKSIKDNQRVDGRFVVLNKEKRQTSAGKPYADILLGNKTGSVAAKLWDVSDKVYDLFDKESVVAVTGRGQIFKERPQIIVETISPVADEDVDYADFLPATGRNIDELKAKLLEFVGSFKNPDIAKVMGRIFAEDGITFKSYLKAPAAKGFHHAYLGGLLEHAIGVASLCDAVAKVYGGRVNRDLLIAGALLHDIGKVREFSYRAAIDYSTEGRLIGHHVIGFEMLMTAAAEAGVSGEAVTLLGHLILSHHGSYEYQSPVLPQTMEALLLHLCDDADAKINAFEQIAGKADEGAVWSPYSKILERYIYLKKLEDIMGEGLGFREDEQALF